MTAVPIKTPSRFSRDELLVSELDDWNDDADEGIRRVLVDRTERHVNLTGHASSRAAHTVSRAAFKRTGSDSSRRDTNQFLAAALTE